jgi:hypothetical protein
MKFRLRLIAILFLLLITLTVPTTEPVRADTWACDLSANEGAEACTTRVIECIFANGDLCFTEYYYCQNNNQIAHDDCEFVSGESPDPWPVIDERRSWCLQGCQACNEIENPWDRLQCSLGCTSACNELYPKY